MSDNNFNNIVQSMLKGMDGFLSTKTVVGEPVTISDTIIVPFVDVSFGMGAGNVAKEKAHRLWISKKVWRMQGEKVFTIWFLFV